MPTSVSLSEDQLLIRILDLAKLKGWRRAHFRPARTERGWRTPVQGDGKGFPDLILVRAPELVVAELKRQDGKTTLEQEDWLRAFELCGIECYVWRPGDWPAICARLMRHAERKVVPARSH